MVYDWDVHQETCYKMYIQEGRSLEDIMLYLKSVHSFAPSRRAFQAQFRRWNFPSKQRPAYKDDQLVQRVKELWGKNLSQREMLRVLNEEDGFDIKARELIRVRTRNGLLLRLPNSDKSRAADVQGEADSPDEESSAAALSDEDAASALPHNHHHQPQQETSLQPVQQPSSIPLLDDQPDITEFPASPEKPDKRRKRNRFTKNASGFMTRFPSETTLDQARLNLALDQATYRNVRSTFQQICHDEHVYKKTVAGPEKWEAAKTRLIHQIPELQNVLWVSKDHLESKKLALDVICTDVTKRMRNTEARMTLADAKNAIGVNPQQSRDIRVAFQQVLNDAQFTCKSDATPQQWEDLKRRWGERSGLIKKILDGMESDPDAQNKARALEVLASDVMKRLRDSLARKDPKKKQHSQIRTTAPPTHGDPEPATSHMSPPASDQMDLGDDMTPSTFDDVSEVSHTPQMAFRPTDTTITAHLQIPLQPQTSNLAHSRDPIPQATRTLGSSMPSGMQLDPQLGSPMLFATNAEASFLPFVPQQYVPTAPSSQVFNQCPPTPAVPTVYLACVRLHPMSSFIPPHSLWMTTIASHSLQEFRHAAVVKFPGALCVRVEGVLKNPDGREGYLPIEQDHHLAAYLLYMQGAEPMFSVELVWRS